MSMSQTISTKLSIGRPLHLRGRLSFQRYFQEGSVPHRTVSAPSSTSFVSAASIEIQQAELIELQGRQRRARYVHESLLRQLRVASQSGRFDPVEWRRLRGDLPEICAQLHPGEFALTLEGLASLRSVDSNFLRKTLRPLGYLAYYMKASELVASISSLSILCGSEKPEGSANQFQEVNLAVNVMARHMTELNPNQIIKLMEALLKLGLLSPYMLQISLEQFPAAFGGHLSTGEILSFLRILCEAAYKSSNLDSHHLLGLQVALSNARTELRNRLQSLQQAELVAAVSLSTEIEHLLNELGLGSVSEEPPVREMTLAQLLDRSDRMQLSFLITDGTGFHRQLLGRLAEEASECGGMLELSPSDCTMLSTVLAKSTGKAGFNESVSNQSALPPQYLSRLCPPLVEQILEKLELLKSDELLASVESLCLHLGYRDDYLADRCADALKLRLLPVFSDVQYHENASEFHEVSILLLCRALRALSTQALVPFVELLGPALKALAKHAEKCSQIGNPIEKSLLCHLGADIDSASEIAFQESILDNLYAGDSQGQKRIRSREKSILGRAGASARANIFWILAFRSYLKSGRSFDRSKGILSPLPTEVSEVVWALDLQVLEDARADWNRICELSKDSLGTDESEH
eukprot:TRINITY_DN27784_c0_g1_i1.p1 TRINITY_DN27784_c0_g1~~TRINITY_DN27784_c0_g1_i1.p1  ORF type:complete len:637 (-),score=97.77 TRINITY_DN27784_c0_g1_i1:9-1919(-)